MSKRTELTPSQRGWLEHLRRAQGQGVTLVQYARSVGVKVGSLYEARRQLALRGVLLEGLASALPAQGMGEFVPVQVVSGPRQPNEAVCRLRSPGGWVIECAEWPQAGWVGEMCRGGEA